MFFVAGYYAYECISVSAIKEALRFIGGKWCQCPAMTVFVHRVTCSLCTRVAAPVEWFNVAVILAAGCDYHPALADVGLNRSGLDYLIGRLRCVCRRLCTCDTACVVVVCARCLALACRASPVTSTTAADIPATVVAAVTAASHAADAVAPQDDAPDTPSEASDPDPIADAYVRSLRWSHSVLCGHITATRAAVTGPAFPWDDNAKDPVTLERLHRALCDFGCVRVLGIA